MSDLLSIASSGVTAYQRALATVSNNIANVNTEGYTRQDVTLTANQPRQFGTGYLGTGTRFEAVQRQYDAFIEANLRKSSSDLESQKPLLSYVNRLIDVMGDESIGLTTAMNRFFESARDLSSDPASVVSRSIFLRDADGLAARFRQLAGQFDMLDNETRQSVETDVGQVNALTSQLAALNKQMTRHTTVASQPSELLDQRDLLLRKLSGLVEVKTEFETNGAVVVSLDQNILVNQNTARALSVQASVVEAGQLEFVIDPYGSPEPIPGITSGKIGGTMTFRDQVLQTVQASLNDLATTLAQEINTVHRDGVDAEGQLGGDLFAFAAGQSGQAAGMNLLIQDANRVAAAGQFRVIDAPLNTGTAQARISYKAPTFEGPTSLLGDLALAQTPQTATVGVNMSVNQPFASLGLVALGTQDLSLTLNNPGEGQSFQVLTRDGRHLLGTTLTAKEQALLVQKSNGLEAGATYSANGLNATYSSANSPTYLDMDIFMGAKAEVRLEQQFNLETGEVLAPIQRSAELTGGDFVSFAGPIAANTFTLNGQALSALNTTGPLQLGDIVTWLNDQSPQTGINASAVAGQLVLSRPSTNTTDDIRLGLGSTGTPQDLKKLGFDTRIVIAGSAADDLLVFVTDRSSQPGTALVSAQFAGIEGDAKQALRESPMTVKFSSSSAYQMVDKASQTVLAERQLTLDPSSSNLSLSYRGLKLVFSTAPKAGDVFTMDSNKDGIGNNETLLQLVALEDQRLMPGGLTITEAYIERVNLVGNVARQAAISQQALEVVYQQAQDDRDSISGVSLDEEASALVRFQQAYQANAKVMQTAMSMFDAILQIR
ncbi:flagellar hook-associated protein FlgK [Limnohabitans sp. WS1]|uniref:flagellar hook-associated protein FlgK n=1 Tax=Limnohabitans sp. WS1 TaxID=1100726 RepID=UPI000D39EDE9|nr:flagellar hook-associated protein FlgK [Limnohabitans sp. WS1]PUE18831.1 flagellar hook-associated protein FlgK [Limnohabitans sp. WS1]